MGKKPKDPVNSMVEVISTNFNVCSFNSQFKFLLNNSIEIFT